MNRLLQRFRTFSNKQGKSKDKSIYALFGWRIQPESASHNSIFLSREISQLFSQTVFSSHAKSASQPASQPAEQGVRPPAGAYCRPAAMCDGSTQKWMLLAVHYPSLRPRPPPAPLHPYPTDFYCFYYLKIINQATDYTTREACKQ